MTYLKELGQYADYISLFSFVKKDKHSQNNLHSDFREISEWAHQWNMLFNSDPRKQAAEVYFWRKQSQGSPLPLEFNDNTYQTVEVNPDHSLDKNVILIFILITK